MLVSLQNAIVALLKETLPLLFAGAAPAQASFVGESWDFDPLSADPLAGEASPEDAQSDLTFDAANPVGPYTLPRPPYPGPKRVYLRSPEGELVALSDAEVHTDALDPSVFTLALSPSRDTTGFDQLRILYGVIAVASRLKTRHRVELRIEAADSARAEQALALALSVLALNRALLMERAAFDYGSGAYAVSGKLTSLKLATGAASASTLRSLQLTAELELKVERALNDNEGRPIVRIASPGRPAGKPVDIEPILPI